MIVDCEYQLHGDDFLKLDSCATMSVIDEHKEAISAAFRKINVTIEVDDEWGFCKIIAVNNQKVLD